MTEVPCYAAQPTGTVEPVETPTEKPRLYHCLNELRSKYTRVYRHRTLRYKLIGKPSFMKTPFLTCILYLFLPPLLPPSSACPSAPTVLFSIASGQSFAALELSPHSHCVSLWCCVWWCFSMFSNSDREDISKVDCLGPSRGSNPTTRPRSHPLHRWEHTNPHHSTSKDARGHWVRIMCRTRKKVKLSWSYFSWTSIYL